MFLFKYAIRNILKKKARAFLIIFSVAVSCAMFFSSVSISNTVVDLATKQLKSYNGKSDIYIQAKSTAKDQFFSIDEANNEKSHLSYAVGVIKAYGQIKLDNDKRENINIMGANMSDMDTFNPILFKEPSSVENFNGNDAIISVNFADKHKLKVGDTFTAKIQGTEKILSVRGIAKNTGLFTDSGGPLYIVIPKSTLASIFDRSGKVNTIFIKIKHSENLQNIISNLSDKYSDCTVTVPVTSEEINEKTMPISVSFLVMTLITLLLSITIIYSSFKVIAQERTKEIGTFKSVGATKWQSVKMILSEGVLYGIFGGILAVILGAAILTAMASLISSTNFNGMSFQINFSALWLAATFLLALALCALCSLFPAIKASKLQIKDILVQNTESREKRKIWRFAAGIVFIAFVLIALLLVPDKSAIPVCFLSVILIILSIVLIAPVFVDYLARFLRWLFKKASINIGLISASNIKSNKQIINSIVLLAVGISCILMITNLGQSLIYVENQYYSQSFNYDIWMRGAIQNNIVPKVSNYDGVKSSSNSYEAAEVKIADSTYTIKVVEGIDTSNFLDFWHLKLYGDRSDLMNKLNDEKSIILSTTLQSELNVKKGDSIKLIVRGEKRSYKIIGFIDNMSYNGSYAMMSADNIKDDFGLNYYTNIYIKSKNDPEKLCTSLNNKFYYINSTIITVNQFENANNKNNNLMMEALNGFSLIALLICIISIINNLIMSYTTRQRGFAMMRSVGMSKRQNKSIIMTESLFSGFIGGLFGVLAGCLLISIIPHILAAMNMAIPMTYSIELFALFVAVSMVIMLLCSLVVVQKSSKLNIIDSIKYE